MCEIVLRVNKNYKLLIYDYNDELINIMNDLI